jgi:hypothetical protein
MGASLKSRYSGLPSPAEDSQGVATHQVGDVEVSEWQLKVALTLACAFGHMWGRIEAEMAWALVLKGGLSLLSEMATKAYGWTWPGLTPHLDARGNLAHTTGSGRCSWEVSQNSVVLTVARPQGEAIRVMFQEGVGWSADATGVPFGPRHTSAMREMMHALAHGPGVMFREFEEDYAELLEYIKGHEDPVLQAEEAAAHEEWLVATAKADADRAALEAEWVARSAAIEAAAEEIVVKRRLPAEPREEDYASLDEYLLARADAAAAEKLACSRILAGAGA